MKKADNDEEILAGNSTGKPDINISSINTMVQNSMNRWW